MARYKANKFYREIEELHLDRRPLMASGRELKMIIDTGE